MEETKCDFCSLSQMLAKAKKHPPLLMQYLRLMMITIGKGLKGSSRVTRLGEFLAHWVIGLL
jgi:hypothetical protein